MKSKDNVVGKLKITRRQGEVMGLLTAVLPIHFSRPDISHVSLHQVNMVTERWSAFQTEDTPSVDEVCQSGTIEVLYATIVADFIMCDADWNNSVGSSVEAKLRLFREGEHTPWKLHYVMFILPYLYLRENPYMYAIKRFANPEQFTQLLVNPGKFHTRCATHEAIDRSANAVGLLRMSQLILGESVAPLRPPSDILA